MATYYNYIVIIGRAHGDDEGIPEADVVAGYEYTNVYITHFITSQSPINVESSR